MWENKRTFKNKNRLLNELESSPKSSIYEIMSLWIRLITILELHISIAVHHFDTVFVLIGYTYVP